MMALSTQQALRCDQKIWKLHEEEQLQQLLTPVFGVHQHGLNMPNTLHATHENVRVRYLKLIRGSTRSKRKRTPWCNTLLDKLQAAAPTAAPAVCIAALSRHFGKPVTKLRPGILAVDTTSYAATFFLSIIRMQLSVRTHASSDSNTEARPPNSVHL